MFALQPPHKPSSASENEPSTKCCTPNILPCRIHHDGPIQLSDRYWAPSYDEQQTSQTAHFRGRKLRGRRVAIPEGYLGVVATPTDRVMPAQKDSNKSVTEEDMENEPEEPVKVLEEQRTFDGFVVWDHEAVPAADDPFVKGVEEWLKLAEAMNSSTVTMSNGQGKSS